MGKLIHAELSRKIIGAAMHVANKMKPGLDEKLHERALLIELRKLGHTAESQKEFPVFYEGELIGNLVPDLIVDEKVLVDPKVAVAFNEAHIAQMVGYLSITGLDLALLLNFKTGHLEWKRVVLRQNREPDSPDLHA